MTPNIDETFSSLKSQLDAHADEDLNKPRHKQRDILRITGLSQGRLQNWLKRHGSDLELSTDQESQSKNSRRILSTSDAIKLVAANEATRRKIPISAACQLAVLVSEHARELFSYVGSPIKRKWIFLVSLEDEEIDILKFDSEEQLDLTDEELPNLYVVIHADRIIQDTLNSLGIVQVQGTAKDLREAADALENIEKHKRK